MVDFTQLMYSGAVYWPLFGLFSAFVVIGTILWSTVDIKSVQFSVITEENLKLIEKHDINHLFSYSNYIKTQTAFDSNVFQSFMKPTKNSKYFLVDIDCEMMMCETGRQIGRVSIIDNLGNVIYDKFIKPESTVLDYFTKYSGLTPENTGSGISLTQFKNEILEIIGTNTCIVGHGLEHDLEVMNLYVDKIIDTAYLFLNTDGHKVKLSQLSKMYFEDVIQDNEHCSVEDARCCLKLLAYKITQMHSFLNPTSPTIDLNAVIVDGTSESDTVENYIFRMEESVDSIERLSKSDIYTIFIFDHQNEAYLAFKQN